jgi:integrase
MRRGEILNLIWKDVDFNRSLVTVQKSKNGERRYPCPSLFQTL